MIQRETPEQLLLMMIAHTCQVWSPIFEKGNRFLSQGSLGEDSPFRYELVEGWGYILTIDIPEQKLKRKLFFPFPKELGPEGFTTPSFAASLEEGLFNDNKP